MMRDLNQALRKYQQRIGTYDQHDWERSVEQKLLEGLGGPVPKKTVKLLPQLIDVDFIRGSAFGRAKPLLGFVSVTWLGIKAAVFFPFWWRWWIKHVGSTLVRLVFLAYCFQLGVLAHYLAHHTRPDCAPGDGATSPCGGPDFALLSGTEVVSCIILMISLSILHAHMTSTQTQRQPSSVGQPEPLVSLSKYGPGRVKVNVKAGHHPPPPQPLSPDLEESSPTYWSSGSQTNGTGFKKPRQMTARWRRAMSEDPSFKPRLSPAKRQQGLSLGNKDSVKEEAFSGDEEEEDEVDEGRVPVPLQRMGSKKLKTARRLSRIRRRSCGTITSQLGDQSGDADKNSSCESCNGSSARVSLDVGDVPEDGSNSPREDCGDNPGQLTPSSTSAKSDREAPSMKSKSSNLSEVDYWSGATTNSEEDCCSCTSTEMDDDEGPGAEPPLAPVGGNRKRRNGETQSGAAAFFQESLFFPFDYSGPFGPATHASHAISPGQKTDKVSCMIWGGSSAEAHKADLSVLDISSAIVRKVEFCSLGDSNDYLWIGVLFSSILAFVPAVFRVFSGTINWGNLFVEISSWNSAHLWNPIDWVWQCAVNWHSVLSCVGVWWLHYSPVAMLVVLRFILAFLTFFLLSVAERTFKRRYMLAKLFHCLTSARRAKRWDLPHFRLSKVRNIKSWLSVRSYLKRHGPQRSVDVIVSAAFVATVALMTGLCADMLRSNGKGSGGDEADGDTDALVPENLADGPGSVSASTIAYTDAVFWCLGLAVFLLRYMTLGVKINAKYRDISVLITEQINLYLRMEEKPHKKDQLILANNVLKLASDLIKELESPFKISGLSANPILYNVTKMVVLSAFSAVLTEMLGFKLKLYKLKFKA